MRWYFSTTALLICDRSETPFGAAFESDSLHLSPPGLGFPFRGVGVLASARKLVVRLPQGKRWQSTCWCAAAKLTALIGNENEGVDVP